jgi:hypothetical protein
MKVVLGLELCKWLSVFLRMNLAVGQAIELVLWVGLLLGILLEIGLVNCIGLRQVFRHGNCVAVLAYDFEFSWAKFRCLFRAKNFDVAVVSSCWRRKWSSADGLIYISVWIWGQKLVLNFANCHTFDDDFAIPSSGNNPVFFSVWTTFYSSLAAENWLMP